jgi:uncharacterized protein (TIGR02611 family)
MHRLEQIWAQLGADRVLPFIRKLLVAVIGSTVVLIGLLLLFLPGPGLFIILLGLGILAIEFVWARRLVQRGRAWVQSIGRSNKKNETP